MSKIRLITFILAAFVLLLPSLTQADLTSGLVAYWSFDNCDAYDDSDNGHIGQRHGNPECVDGIEGQAFSFDGVDDYIEVPNDPSLNPSAVTVSAWFKVNDFADSEYSCKWQTLIFKQSPLDADNHYYALNLGFGNLICANTYLTFGSLSNVCSKEAIQTHVWYHVVATYDSTQVKQYINGVLQGSSPTGAPLNPGNLPLFIGYTGMWCGWYWNGLIDEVRIYNRALTEAEIQALYVANSFKLPDTGQTKCYDTAGSIISCEGTGQDGAYTINPMSFTDNGDGTVTDNNTGLMWQKEDDGNNYNWYQASGTYDAFSNPSSQDVCGSLNLGEHSDWRLPTKKELMSIVDYGIPFPGPTINATYFPNTKSSVYWPSPTAAYDPDFAWVVVFYNGYVAYSNRHYGYYVRWVRGGSILISRL